MPLRSPKMYSFIFGFHRRVWWPKWTPDSSSSLRETCGAVVVGFSVVDKYVLLAISDRSRHTDLRAFRPRATVLWQARGSRSVGRSERLTLAELEASAGAALAVLLALLDAGVARDQA